MPQTDLALRNYMQYATYTDEAAAEALGLPVAELRRLRKKSLPDLKRWDEDSIKKMAELIAGDVPVADPAGQTFARLRVERTVPNPNIVLAMCGEMPVRVRVRSSANFVRGMYIEGARHVDGDLWAYEGKLPRLKGRWI